MARTRTSTDGTAQDLFFQLLGLTRGSGMNQTFRYLSARGFVAIILVHPFYKFLHVLKDYTADASADVTLSLIFPIPVIVSLNGNIISFAAMLAPGKRIPFFSSDISSWKKFRWVAIGICLSLSMIFWLVVIVILNGMILLPGRILMTAFRCWSGTLTSAFRSAPILIAALVIIFTTGDAWRLYGNESAVRFVTLTVIIFAMGMVAMITAVMQLEGGWRQTADKAGNSEAEVSELAKKTPARNLVIPDVTPIDADLWYMKLVRINVRFMFWFTLVLALFSIALITFMIFVFIGMVAVSAGATQDLLQSHSIDTISKWTFLGQTFVLTRPLLLLSVLFGCVAALTFATASLQDERSLNRFLQFALHYHRRSLSALDFYLHSIADLQQHLSWQTINSELEDHNETEILRIFQMAITQAPPRVIATVFTMARRRNFDSWAGSQGLAILNDLSDHKFAKISTEDLDFVLASAAAVPAQATVIQSIQHRMEIRPSSKRPDISGKMR